MAGALTEASAGQNRCRILVVDDDLDIRESLSSILTEEGFEVSTALNGLEALIAVNEGPSPHVIVLDLSMPVLDGHQLLTIMRERGLLARIPVIVVSAVSFRLTNGSVANLPKPIHYESLLELVHQHCTCCSPIHNRPAVVH
jgi:CheY-like chemotaxis protein